MNISLTPKLEEMVKSRVNSGLYNSASEVIREALRLLDRQEYTLKMEKIRTHLAEGEEQADRSEFSAATAKSIIKKGLKRSNAR